MWAKSTCDCVPGGGTRYSAWSLLWILRQGSRWWHPSSRRLLGWGRPPQTGWLLSFSRAWVPHTQGDWCPVCKHACRDEYPRQIIKVKSSWPWGTPQNTVQFFLPHAASFNLEFDTHYNECDWRIWSWDPNAPWIRHLMQHKLDMLHLGMPCTFSGCHHWSWSWSSHWVSVPDLLRGICEQFCLQKFWLLRRVRQSCCCCEIVWVQTLIIKCTCIYLTNLTEPS